MVCKEVIGAKELENKAGKADKQCWEGGAVLDRASRELLTEKGTWEPRPQGGKKVVGKNGGAGQKSIREVRETRLRRWRLNTAV